MNYKTYHKPVLLNYLLKNFNLSVNSIVFDGTVGFGGHAEAILNQFPDISYYGFDKDSFAIKMTKERCQSFSNLHLLKKPFSTMFDTIKEKSIIPSHILLDLGVSSYQIDQSERGFSFQKNEPLDMRMNTSQSLTAEKVINTYSKEMLVTILIEQGNVKFPNKFVEKIIEIRSTENITSTFQLIELIKTSFFFKSRQQFIAETTRIFQAIRVEVNSEMTELDLFLKNVYELKNVIVAIITFQPNEDRKIKSFIKENNIEKITKKPLQSTYHERKNNPREKTAKLRIFRV